MTSDAPPHAPALDLVVRRSLLLFGRDLDALHDQLDGAELVAMAGWPDAARLLCDVVFIRRGFSAAGLRLQDEVAARLRPAGEARPQPPTPSPRRGQQMFACAIADLRDLLSLSDALPPLPPSGGAVAGFALPSQQPPLPLDRVAFATFVGELRVALQGADDPAGGAPLGRLFARLRADVAARLPFDLSTGDACPLPDLAARLAFNSLRRFAIVTDRLAHGPFGSPALCAAVARLDDAGLGPYFRNVTHLVQEGQALLGLIQLAAGAATTDRDVVERWCVLLSGELHGPRMQALIDDLGDAGLLRAIWGLLVFEQVLDGRPDRGVFWRVRDAGLDAGDVALAASAQRAVTRWWPTDPVEWVILADVGATLGDREGMESALHQALRLDPRHVSAIERQRALHHGEMDAFVLHGGLLTPSSRKAVRAPRRAEGGAALAGGA